MSLPPNLPLRWVELDVGLIRRALEAQAELGDEVDLRADAYGFGRLLVEPLAASLGLRPGAGGVWIVEAHRLGAQRLHCQVVNVKEVPAGTSVSYGGHYVTPSASRLALCSAGFADGVPRLNPVGGVVEIGRHTFPIAGRIAMDQLIVDVGTHDVSVGADVTVWGGLVSLEQWSGWAARSIEAIGSGIAQRVQRQVVGR